MGTTIPQRWDGLGYVIIDEDGRIVATAYSEANARLIAAAPDLLAALKGARETIFQLVNSRWSECEGSDSDWVGGIDAAIARATGEA